MEWCFKKNENYFIKTQTCQYRKLNEFNSEKYKEIFQEILSNNINIRKIATCQYEYKQREIHMTPTGRTLYLVRHIPNQKYQLMALCKACHKKGNFW